MDALKINDLKSLMATRGEPCVSIHMPVHASPVDRQEDSLRLKNLLQQAEEQLADGWLRRASARAMLEPIRDSASQRAFWDNRSSGLAVFATPHGRTYMHVPLDLKERVIVNSRFQVKPLLSLLNGRQEFLLLTLSQNCVRLWEGDRFTLRESTVPDLPQDKRSALNYDGADRGAQSHSASSAGMGQGKQTAVFHGQGGMPDTAKDDLEQYFRLVDAALRPMLRFRRDPMVLAAVDYALPIYRRVNHYPHLIDTELVGNYDHFSGHQLHSRAWPLVAEVYARRMQDAAQRWHALISIGKASDDIREIVPAAMRGQVEVLFVDHRDEVWGNYDEQGGQVELLDEANPLADDLLDLAATRTALNRGTVYAVQRAEIPRGGPVAAVFRY
jgi:hypothetical protein